MPKTGLKKVSELYTNYELSVGRNTNYLLNLSPKPDGSLATDDANTYVQLGNAITDCYNKSILGTTQGLADPAITLDLGAVLSLNRVVISEDQTAGQLVLKYTLILSETPVNISAGFVGQFANVTGSSIGNKRIEILNPPVRARYLIFWPTLATGVPTISKFAAYSCKTV